MVIAGILKAEAFTNEALDKDDQNDVQILLVECLELRRDTPTSSAADCLFYFLDQVRIGGFSTLEGPWISINPFLLTLLNLLSNLLTWLELKQQIEEIAAFPFIGVGTIQAFSEDHSLGNEESLRRILCLLLDGLFLIFLFLTFIDVFEKKKKQ